MHSILHDKLDHLLIRTRIGEATTGGLAGGSFFLDFFNVATPLAAFIGAVLAIIAGWYTMRLKRLEYSERLKSVEVELEIDPNAASPEIASADARPPKSD